MQTKKRVHDGMMHRRLAEKYHEESLHCGDVVSQLEAQVEEVRANARSWRIRAEEATDENIRYISSEGAKNQTASETRERLHRPHIAKTTQLTEVQLTEATSRADSEVLEAHETRAMAEPELRHETTRQRDSALSAVERERAHVGSMRSSGSEAAAFASQDKEECRKIIPEVAQCKLVSRQRNVAANSDVECLQASRDETTMRLGSAEKRSKGSEADSL